jgi:hypothetical protein
MGAECLEHWSCRDGKARDAIAYVIASLALGPVVAITHRSRDPMLAAALTGQRDVEALDDVPAAPLGQAGPVQRRGLGRP